MYEVTGTRTFMYVFDDSLSSPKAGHGAKIATIM